MKARVTWWLSLLAFASQAEPRPRLPTATHVTTPVRVSPEIRRRSTATRGGVHALQGRAQAFAREFGKGPAHVSLVQRIGKPIVELTPQSHRIIWSYQELMAQDTVEVLFQPGASRWGHLLMRVGERVYDFPGEWNARNRDFVETFSSYYGNSPMYGFVMRVPHETVALLNQHFAAAARNPGPFDSMGAAGKSCASFITAILAREAPELGVAENVAAIGTAEQLLGSARVAFITVYSNELETVTARPEFKFRRLEPGARD